MSKPRGIRAEHEKPKRFAFKPKKMAKNNSKARWTINRYTAWHPFGVAAEEGLAPSRPVDSPASLCAEAVSDIPPLGKNQKGRAGFEPATALGGSRGTHGAFIVQPSPHKTRKTQARGTKNLKEG